MIRHGARRGEMRRSYSKVEGERERFRDQPRPTYFTYSHYRPRVENELKIGSTNRDKLGQISLRDFPIRKFESRPERIAGTMFCIIRALWVPLRSYLIKSSDR